VGVGLSTESSTSRGLQVLVPLLSINQLLRRRLIVWRFTISAKQSTKLVRHTVALAVAATIPA
jgi:hypothetical protein